MSTIDEGELDRLEERLALDKRASAGRPLFTNVSNDTLESLLAAARALSAEKAAREEAERDEQIAVVRAGAAEARATTAEAETTRLRERVKAAVAEEREACINAIRPIQEQWQRFALDPEAGGQAGEFQGWADTAAECIAAIRSRENSNE